MLIYNSNVLWQGNNIIQMYYSNALFKCIIAGQFSDLVQRPLNDYNHHLALSLTKIYEREAQLMLIMIFSLPFEFWTMYSLNTKPCVDYYASALQF